MIDTNTYIQRMETTNPLMEPVVRAAIQSLQLPLGSHGLDAGCGIGLQALRLAGAVGPTGRVTGLDICAEFLRHAKRLVDNSGLSERIFLREGDVRRPPFKKDIFDWAWSSSCVGYAESIEPVPALKELARVVKPGGIVAIFAWSSERLLPGYPLLESRLHATSSGLAPFVKGKKPELHFSRALGWLRRAGLEGLKAQTFAGEAYAPLEKDVRSALAALLEMRWPGVEAELTREDASEYRRLCVPESPDFILNHPDYHAFFTCSMFSGTVAG